MTLQELSKQRDEIHRRLMSADEKSAALEMLDGLIALNPQPGDRINVTVEGERVVVVID